MATDDKARIEWLERNLALMLETLLSVHAGIRAFAIENPQDRTAVMLSKMTDALVNSKIPGNYQYHSSKVDEMAAEIKRTYHPPG